MTLRRRLMILVTLLLTSSNAAFAQPLFQAPSRYFPTGGVVGYLTAGRLDQDAFADAAVSHPYDSNVAVLLGTPRGDLVSRGVIPVPTHPWGIALADMNRDGIADLVTGGNDPSGIVVLRGRGDRTYAVQPLVATPRAVDGLVVADLDADGWPDVITCSIDGSQTLLNDGHGGFLAAQLIPFGGYGIPFAIGRVDGDAYPDLVAGDANGIDVYPGLGNGAFGAANFFAGGCYVSQMSLGDLDGDGDLDAVGVDGCSEEDTPNRVITFRNNGLGSFVNAGSTFAADGDPASVPMGDVNGDHHADVLCLATSYYGGPVLNFMTGFDGQTFQHQFALEIHSNRQIVTFDVDGDGAQEVLQADGDAVSMFRGSLTSAFGTPEFATDTQPLEVVAAHIDDGPTTDLAVLRDPFDTDGITFALAGGGTYDLRVDAGFGSASYLDFADLNGDGHPDLVTGSYEQTHVYFGVGNGNFRRPGLDFGFGGAVRPLILDGDGLPDLLTARWDSLAAWRNRGDSTFERIHAWTPGGNMMRVGDLNGDGFPDLVMRRGDGSSMVSGTLVVIRLSVGNGDLGPETVVDAGGAISDLQIGDLDTDDSSDILICRGDFLAPAWLHNHGNGTFFPVQALACFPGARIAFADFNQDGKLDAGILAGSVGGNVGIGFGHGNGQFDTPVWFGTGHNPRDIDAGDLDGDGRMDLAVLNAGGYEETGRVELILNRIPPGSSVSVEAPHAVAGHLSLSAPSPNPTRGAMSVRLSAGGARRLEARVLDLQGREVRALREGTVPPGLVELRWNGRSSSGTAVTPGVYFLNVRTETETATRRIVVLASVR